MELKVLTVRRNRFSSLSLDQFPKMKEVECLFIFQNNSTVLDEKELIEKFPNLQEFDCYSLVDKCLTHQKNQNQGMAKRVNRTQSESNTIQIL